MKYILTRGMQASNKSTWAKQFVKENQDWKRVSRDDFRFMLSNYTFDDKNEKIVTLLVDKSLEELIKLKKYNIIIDEMHLNEKRLKERIKFIENLDSNALIEIREFPISLSQAIERDSKREFSLGKSVLKRTYDMYEIELKRMYENSKYKERHQPQLSNCMIFDIDGTLAKSLNRKTFDESQVLTDEPIDEVIMINNFIKSEIKIFIVSGRHNNCKADTEKWLKENNVRYNNIFMRKADDNRKDTIIKREIYEEHIKNKYNVLSVFDDRPFVCQMWVELGLFVFNVNQDPLCLNNF